MTNALKQKLDAKGRYRLRKRDFSDAIPILVRTATNPSSEQQERLNLAGYHYRVVVDDVLSGYVDDLEHLEKLADLSFVRQIEVSAPLYAEKN
ncbi:MAG: hypothetical protein QNJ64_05585 [Crocosphaera sp.]|nr:hypothetical protein [Crocosphaera sp.]